MKASTIGVIALAAVLGTAATVHASPVIYTVRTVASGRLGSVSFTDARVTISFVGDTKHVHMTAVGGAVEIVGDDCGILYKDGTETGLGDALRQFDATASTLSPLYLRTRSEAFSEETFDADFRSVLSRSPQVFAPVRQDTGPVVALRSRQRR